MDEYLEYDIFYVLERFSCSVCSLVVEGTREASAAGFVIEYKSLESTGVTDYFSDAIEAARDYRYEEATGTTGERVVNGQVVVPVGGQLEVPTPRG